MRVPNETILALRQAVKTARENGPKLGNLGTYDADKVAKKGEALPASQVTIMSRKKWLARVKRLETLYKRGEKGEKGGEKEEKGEKGEKGKKGKNMSERIRDAVQLYLRGEWVQPCTNMLLLRTLNTFDILAMKVLVEEAKEGDLVLRQRAIPSISVLPPFNKEYIYRTANVEDSVMVTLSGDEITSVSKWLRNWHDT